LVNFGVGKVIDSTHPEFQAGDLVWGMSGWEEYTLVSQPESLFKINHTELPLSYYTGVLGERADNFILQCIVTGERERGNILVPAA
jgi:NADPH-dependent curcumin reductase CurA